MMVNSIYFEISNLNGTVMITYIKNFAVWHSRYQGIVERMPNREKLLTTS